MNYDVIIIGAGAAGLFCAAKAGQRWRKVLLVDHSQKVGEKIRISGGGRCNFTNLFASHENYISQNPHFYKSALKRYTQHDFIKLVESYNIAYHEKTLGQLFCDGSSQQIIDMLVDMCGKNNVEIATSTKVNKVTKLEVGFEVDIQDNKNISCQSLVIATGGLSIPKMGATSFGYDIARQFNINIIEPKPALVPFLLDWTHELAGIAVKDICVSANGKSFREDMLFTHKGLSGPAILQISSYWQDGGNISLNLLPSLNFIQELLKLKNEKPKQDIQTIISGFLPKRLANYLCNQYGWQGRICELSNKYLENICDKICNWQIKPQGTEGYRTAEVTLGGVDTDEISPKTFESKKVTGLYFIGEILDVTGYLGGYNFQWAWASAHAAGEFC
jgi:predicted Rossmann fold flavoprotein